MSTNNKELLFCPLGGVGEIGANMSLYGYGEKNFHEWIMIDIGVTFTDDSVPGIDLVVPDPDFIIQKKKTAHSHYPQLQLNPYWYFVLKSDFCLTFYTSL